MTYIRETEHQLSSSEESSDERVDVDAGNVFANLNDSFTGTNNNGPNINADLAELTKNFLSLSLNDNSKKEKCDKHPRPDNCGFLEVPKVNEEIWKLMGKSIRNQDWFAQETQRYMLLSVVPVL